MTTQEQQPRGNGSGAERRRPEEIERDLEARRASMDTILDDLRSRFSPGGLADEAVDRLRGGAAGDYARSLGGAVRDNPVPVALIGAGIAWLALSGGRSHHGDGAAAPEPRGEAELEDEYLLVALLEDPELEDMYHARYGGEEEVGVILPEDLAGSGETSRQSAADSPDAGTRGPDRGTRGAAAAAGDKARSAYEGARGAAADAGRKASEKAGRLAEGAGEAGGEARRRGRSAADAARLRLLRARAAARRRAAAAGGATRRGAAEARRGVADFIDEQPFVAAGLGLALGAALGGLLPRTRAEDAWVGDASDRVRYAAGAEAAERGRQAREAAGAAAGAAADQAREEGLTPGGAKAAAGDVADRAGRAAEAGREEAGRQGLDPDGLDAALTEGERKARRVAEAAEQAARDKLGGSGGSGG